jgi:hypothetical protein
MAHRPRRCRRIGRNRAATPAVCTCTHTIHVRRFACFACVSSVVRVLPQGTFALPERQPSPWFRVHELTRELTAFSVRVCWRCRRSHSRRGRPAATAAGLVRRLHRTPPDSLGGRPPPLILPPSV